MHIFESVLTHFSRYQILLLPHVNFTLAVHRFDLELSTNMIQFIINPHVLNCEKLI